MREKFNEEAYRNKSRWTNPVLTSKMYISPTYYEMSIYSDATKKIYNGSWNYIRHKYNDENGGDDYWDYVKEKETYYYYEDRNNDGKDERYSDWRWKYVYDADGAHPTISGEGANLKGGAGNDTIENQCDNVAIDASSGNDKITNNGSDVRIYAGSGDNECY